MQRQKASEDIQWPAKRFPLIVIAENIHSPSNMGLIMRGCECFGIARLYFTGPHSNTDTYKFKKAARSAQKYLPTEKVEDSIALIQKLRSEGYKVLALEITNKSNSLHNYKISENAKYVVIVGSERHGLAPETLEIVDEAIHIQQFGKTGSLNVSMALNICLYHFTNQFS